MSRVRVVCGALAVLAAGGCSEPGYEVHLEITGTAQAFAGRILEVQGVPAPPAVPRTGQTGVWTTEVRLCTRDREAFLARPLQVRVLEDGQVRSERQLERNACRLSAAPGEREHDIVYLEENGTLVPALGGDPRTDAACFPPEALIPCPEPRF